jgi:ABC-type transport system involved in multi-copper enzyme maturation permease subunit
MRRLARLNLQWGLNPIVVKELRSRMRDARAFITLTSVLLVLGMVSYLIYRMALAMANYSFAPLSPQIGQTLFIALAFLELMVACAIAPAVTAGAISAEQEKLTYEMLLATPLRPASILWGKLVSALSYVFLLIFAAVPMSSLIFIFGGVALRDMAKALAVLVVVMVTFGILGLFMSAWLKRTSRATVASYLVVVALMFGTVFIYIALGVIRQAEPPRWLLIPNPLSALFSAIGPSLPFEGSPLGFIDFLGMNLTGSVRALAGERISQTSIPRPIYHYSLPFYGGLSLALYLLSTRLVLPTRRWRLSRRDVLVLLALLALFGGAVTLAFASSAGRYEGVAGTITPLSPDPRARLLPAAVEKAVIEAETPTPAPYPPPAGEDLGAIPGAAYPAPGQGGALPEEEQAILYGMVANQILVQNQFGGNPPEAGVVFIVERTDDSAGREAVPQGESILLPELVRQNIAGESGVRGQIEWIGNPDEVIADGAIAYDRNVFEYAFILTLGNLHLQEDGSVLVTAALYDANLNSIAGTYTFKKVGTGWQLESNQE